MSQNQNQQRPAARPAPATQGGGAPAIVKKEDEKTALGLLNKMKGEIGKALPKHMHPDRLARIVTTEMRRVPKLQQCDPLSFIGAVVQCAQLGLEPGSGLGHAYLIPFKNNTLRILECQFIAGYKGLIDLSRRSGKIDGLSSRIVREKDIFEFQYGDDERIVHRPYMGSFNEEGEFIDDAGRILFVYSIARIKGATEPQREVMSRAQIDFIKKQYGKGNPVWEDSFDEMARKTVVRRLSKYLPLSPEHADFFRKDDVAGNESQANWRICTPEGQELLTSYEPQRLEHDPEKTLEVQASSDSAAMPDAVQRADKLKNGDALASAMQELQDARKAAKEAGYDPDSILKTNTKMTVDEVTRTGDANRIAAAADVLNGVMK